MEGKQILAADTRDHGVQPVDAMCMVASDSSNHVSELFLLMSKSRVRSFKDNHTKTGASGHRFLFVSSGRRQFESVYKLRDVGD